MRAHGGFEHNLQSLRVVDLLEVRYAAFDGLNLCFETREGILKHCSVKSAEHLGEVGERFLKRQQPSLEAQLANLADEIAYNNHDVDDGLRSGLLTLDRLQAVAIFRRQLESVRQQYAGLAERRLVHETIRRMINTLVSDLIHQSQANIATANPASVEQVRASPALIDFSPEVRREQQELKTFLFANLYRHYRVNRAASKARHIVRDLFEAFQTEPRLLPPEHQEQFESDGIRAIADYVAGMTDRYAVREHRRLFAVEEG